jgi:hypothetical protein
MFQTKVVEQNQNTHLMFSNSFPQNRAADDNTVHPLLHAG